jgi:GxxExxY protein
MREPDANLNALSERVIRAAIEVHRHLGPGFLESVYEEALAVEFELRGIPFERQKPIPLSYKGHSVGRGALDFLVDQRLVVEPKAVDSIAPAHKAQVISYLKATRTELGLLINFNVKALVQGVKRVVETD